MSRYKKSLGQHILEDASILRRIVQAAAVPRGGRVLEIGAGPGNLTRVIADAVGPQGTVVSVELDTDWQVPLGAVVEEHPWVRVAWGDVLRADLDELLGQDATETPGAWTVVANIPYYITTPIIEMLIARRSLFSRMALLMQREVARRVACVRGRESGSLSHFVQYHCQASVAFDVPAQAFVPPPEVESALLLLEVREGPPVTAPEDILFRIIHTTFRERRKMLRKSLRSLPGLGVPAEVEKMLASAGVAGESRPEELSLEQFAALARACHERAPTSGD